MSSRSLAAAAIAPLGSIFFSWIGRSLVWLPNMPFYSGWDGWWRMNALGTITVVPPALATWLGVRRRPIGARGRPDMRRSWPWPSSASIGLMRFGPPGTTGVLMLTLALPVALYAAVRFGPRGAATAGALAALVVAVAQPPGAPQFGDVPREERHVALQLFELTMATFPLVFGALIAERQAALASGLHSEELRHSFQQALPDTASASHGMASASISTFPRGAWRRSPGKRSWASRSTSSSGSSPITSRENCARC